MPLNIVHRRRSAARRHDRMTPATHRPSPAQALPVWADRLVQLAEALGTAQPALPDDPDLTERDVVDALSAVVDPRDRSQVWLTLAVLSGTLPDENLVIETARRAEFDPTALLGAVRDRTTAESLSRSVVVERNAAVVDVAHTAVTTLTTGIQRVVRETVRRWAAVHDVRMIAWTAEFDAIRDLDPVEADRMHSATAAHHDDVDVPETTIVVPWRTRYLLPEVAIDAPRTPRLRALARWSRSPLGAVGYDLIPITTGETTAPGMPDAFARGLTALRHAATVAPISEAAATEYRGWKTMLGAAGFDGPRIVPVVLPADSVAPSEAERTVAADRFLTGTLPLVLVVGSHEPRKNHLGVLRAAELLWHEGHQFSIVFVGGNAWHSERFQAWLKDLQAVGRPVETASKVPDAVLSALYGLARFTVFPSFNEGFGLPVTESLAAGTPVVTSDFGSMAEIAADGGCLTVDPRDDRSIADGMRRLLTDDDLLAKLRTEGAERPVRTWDDYAMELWDALTA